MVESGIFAEAVIGQIPDRSETCNLELKYIGFPELVANKCVNRSDFVRTCMVINRIEMCC